MEIDEVVDARKHPVGPDGLAPWFRGRRRLLVARGAKVEEHDLGSVRGQARAELVLGPSGRLRAPTLVSGDTVVVGYNEQAYRRVFG